jgi:hypothetical protein
VLSCTSCLLQLVQPEPPKLRSFKGTGKPTDLFGNDIGQRQLIGAWILGMCVLIPPAHIFSHFKYSLLVTMLISFFWFLSECHKVLKA